MFRIDATELKRLLGLLGRFIPKHHTVPILDCIHVWRGGGYAEWTATDLDAWLTVVTDVDADGEGAVCLPHRVLADIAGRVEGEIVFAQDGETVTLRAGRSRFELQTMRADEYPEKPRTKEDLATLPTGELANALRRIAPCASEDLSRPVLTAVCWQLGTMVATDGTRLAVCEGVPDLDRAVLLPGRAAQHLAAMLREESEVLVSAGGDSGQLLLFSWTASGVGYRVVTRQISAPYPDWRAVVPKSDPPMVAILPREKLMAALQRMAVLGRGEKVPRVEMEFGGGQVLLRARGDGGAGQEPVECDAVEGVLKVRAAIPLVLDGLRLAESDAVEMRGWGAEMIQEIREVGRDEWRYYWLPLRGGN